MIENIASRKALGLTGKDASDSVAQTECLIFDVRMPGMSGPDLQQELTRQRREIPIVFITAHAGEADRPRLLELGAIECLFKPFSETALFDAVQTALRGSWSLSPAGAWDCHVVSESAATSHDTPIVFVVDDDILVRESQELLIAFAGWQPETLVRRQIKWQRSEPKSGSDFPTNSGGSST